MGFDSSFEEVKADGTGGIRGHLFGFGSYRIRHLGHVRCNVSQKFHRTTHTHILGSRHTEDGIHISQNNAFAHPFYNLFFGETPLLKEAIHKGFFVLRSTLYKLLTHLFCRSSLAIGDL